MADDVVRAVIAGLLVRAGPGAAEILLTERPGRRLLPGLAPDRSIRRARSTDHVARAVESERIARTRRLAAVDAPDADRFRHENPENPLPLLLVLLDALPAESLGRWAALLADAPRLGIAVVFLDASPLATGALSSTPSAPSPTPSQPALAEQLTGAPLYGLRADEAVELLGSVNEANHEDRRRRHRADRPAPPIAPLTTHNGTGNTD